MQDTRQTIHRKVVELARQLGHDAADLRYDEPIPERGKLDSPELLELILWYESAFDLEVDQEQLTLENFGTIDAMAAYLEKRRS